MSLNSGVKVVTILDSVKNFFRHPLQDMQRYEIILYALCWVLYAVVIFHGLSGCYDAVNRFNVMVFGLILIAALIGFCKSFSARMWNLIFLIANIIFWVIGVALASSSPWYSAVWKTFTT